MPAEIGVMSPVDASIVATLGLALDHDPPASPFDENIVELFEQAVSVPLNVPAIGAVVTVADVATFLLTADVAVHITLSEVDPEDALLLSLT